MVESPLNRSLWLAIVVGWLAQLALVALLPELAQVAGRVAAGDAGNTWAERTRYAGQDGWFVIQGVVVLACLLAGVLSGYLTPRKPWLVAAALVILSLFASWFSQLPSPRSPGILLLWALGPCVGIVLGVAISWRARQRAA